MSTTGVETVLVYPSANSALVSAFGAPIISVTSRQAKVRAAPVVGFFLDHDNFKHTDGNASGHGGPNTLEWSTPGTGANYTEWMK